MSDTDCTAGGKHEWRPIGNTTFSGDTWMQQHRVYGCHHCGKIAQTTNPTAYYDYRRRKPDEVERLRRQEQEQEEYETLCARWKADPDAVEAEHAKAEEKRKAHVAAAIEKSRAERAARKGEVTA